MPELPEVETVCRGLAARMLGRTVVRVEQRRPDLRVPFPDRFEERLTGRCVSDIRRRAKYIVIEFDDGTVLLAHLGMSGRLLLYPAIPNEPPGPHDHVLITLHDGTFVIFQDARRFGLMDLTTVTELAAHPLIACLGPEPLDPGFDPTALSTALTGKITPIKAALLDQRVVAGLGNIYVSEALFRAGISPKRTAATVAGKRAQRLVPAIKAVLADAIEAGGSTLRDYVQASGELGYFQHRFAVYDRQGQPCPDCICDLARTGGIRRLVQAGRSTFYCSTRQR